MAPGPVPIILETIAVPLQPCQDSTYAEIYAAHETIVKLLHCATSRNISEVIIQGDCLTIIKHFAGTNRLRRDDLVRKLDAIWQALSQTSVKVHGSYVPRAGNRVADHLQA